MARSRAVIRILIIIICYKKKEGYNQYGLSPEIIIDIPDESIKSLLVKNAQFGFT